MHQHVDLWLDRREIRRADELAARPICMLVDEQWRLRR